MSLAARALLLAAVNASLVVALLWLVRAPVDTTPLTPAGGESPREQPSNPNGAPPPDIAGLERNQMLARPLFSPDRRPWQPPPAHEPVTVAAPATAMAAEPDEPDPVLLGVGISNGQARALLLNAGGSESAWVGEGDTIWSWTVGEISAQSVTLRQADRAVSLSLFPADPDTP